MKKGIEVNIRFWTDFGKDKKGNTIYYKKEAFAAGKIIIQKSEFHGIDKDEIFFNNLEEFYTQLDKLLRKNDISLVILDENGKKVPRLGKKYPKSTWAGYK